MEVIAAINFIFNLFNQWAELFKNFSMVLIDPFHFISTEQTGVDELPLNWAEGNGLKATVPNPAKIVRHVGFSTNADVFNSNAKLIFLIVARFIASGHTNLESLLV
eukprot:CAMPEP_0194590360 /NCGR_PEP_ID=MMETSP0292-20121207/21296_1 /TAXON_ID=39354 /ORGANISM="Heterosigma akashiwo, Strain CCMP2393" /LENGTH=105 /DNA_ID=CAMNT_0039447973 /DNA_START=181 /DNA_END=498 /DNA_ORIENTATION=-